MWHFCTVAISRYVPANTAIQAWIISIFFFGYLICEIPSNMILSRSKPSLFLPGIMLVWGVLSALMAISNSYGALLAFRFVLGCIEAGFFPGVLYVLSCWYTRAELGMCRRRSINQINQ